MAPILVTPQTIGRLRNQLMISPVRDKDNPLYQVINQLIGIIEGLSASNANGSSNVGPAGINGKDGIPGFAVGNDSGEGSIIIPGPAGANGTSGNDGIQGIPGIGLDGLDNNDIMVFPGPIGPTGATGANGSWSLISSYAPVSDANKDFTGLSAYNEIRVLLVGLTLASAGLANLRVSTDNGATFLSSSGDYVAVLGSGIVISKTDLQFSDTNFAGVAHAGEIVIEGFNLTSPKVSRSNFFSSDGIYLRYMPSASAFNAIRVYSTGGNMNGGTIYVFGR